MSSRVAILFTRVFEEWEGAQALEDEINRLIKGLDLAEGEYASAVQRHELIKKAAYELTVTIVNQNS